MTKRKKITVGILFFVLLIVGIPLIQLATFSTQTAGRIEVNHTIDAPYLMSGTREFNLVYFGYVGCARVCTPILERVDEMYSSAPFIPLHDKLGVLFVNLMPELEPHQPDQFAKSFNPGFEGVYLSQKELMTIDRDFNLFFSKSLSDKTEINHSDYLYLVRRTPMGELILVNIYMTHPLNSEMILKDIRTLVKDNH